MAAIDFPNNPSLNDEFTDGAGVKWLCIDATVDQVQWARIGGSGSPISFTDLTDTPVNYTGAAGYVLVVNGTEDGIIFQTGINATSLNGFVQDAAATANTIALRDGSADIFARLFRSNFGEQGSAPASTADICFRNNSTTDSYMRFMTQAAAKSYLGISAGIRGCRTGSGGGIFTQSHAFTCTRTATGRYTLTHNKGNTNYSITGSAVSTVQGYIFDIITVSNNNITYRTSNSQGTLLDVGVHITMVTW